ncbi:MAG: hypothetical protein JWM21_4149 [Acidobacteria bacterium]|nr:hypothetical protein [Acidobacteriota bacterium]
MASRVVSLHVRRKRSLLLVVGCGLLLSEPTLAQGVGNAAKVHLQEMDRRELQLSGIGKGNVRETDPKQARAMMDQVNEDFQRLLKLHNEIVHAVTGNNSLDYQFIAGATGEIKKRANRLRYTLALDKPATTSTQRERLNLETVSMTADLIMLCRKIESFIKNPIIDTPGTVDAEQLEKARGDLESVVELSSGIRKRADKLKP